MLSLGLEDTYSQHSLQMGPIWYRVPGTHESSELSQGQTRDLETPYIPVNTLPVAGGQVQLVFWVLSSRPATKGMDTASNL